MQYQRWLALILFCPLITPAPAQIRGGPGQGLSSGSVHVHVIYADDRRAGANLQVILMQGSGSTPIATTFTNDKGKADFRNVTVGEYHVEVSGDGIETTASALFEVDTRQVTQSEYVTVRQVQGVDAKTPASKKGTISASDLKVPAKARKELDKANEAMARHDWNKAVELFNKAIAIYPQYVIAYNNLGVAYARLNDSVHEQQALEKAISLDEHSAVACENLAKLYLRQREFPQAEVLLGKALRVDPNNGVYLTLMADVQFMLRNYDAAITTAQKAHAVPDPHPATSHYIAAMAYEQQKRPQEAMAEFQMFLKEEPNGPRADHVRSDILKLQGPAQVSANTQ
jgi:tetratricopeptide (TPR) repeat protein